MNLSLRFLRGRRPDGRQWIGWREHRDIGAMAGLLVALPFVGLPPYNLSTVLVQLAGAALGGLAGRLPDGDLVYSNVSRHYIRPALFFGWLGAGIGTIVLHGAALLDWTAALSTIVGATTGAEALHRALAWLVALWLIVWPVAWVRIMTLATLSWMVILKLGHRRVTHRWQVACVVGAAAGLGGAAVGGPRTGLFAGLVVLAGMLAHDWADGTVRLPRWPRGQEKFTGGSPEVRR
jgi:hypothetical protein